MDWLKTAESLMNNPTFNSLAGSVLGNKAKTKAPAPAPSVPTPVIQVQNPVQTGMSTNKIMMIVGGAVAVVAVLIFALRK